MTFQQALDQLVLWLDQSLGQPLELPSGQKKVLRLTQDYTPDEIDDCEDDWDLDLPAAYRQFLLTVGACEIFYGGTGAGRGISFSRLDAVTDLYHEYFDRKNSLLFTRFLPIGGVYASRQVAVFDLTREAPNFALFSDELQATDWATQSDANPVWINFEDWLIRVVELEGEPEPSP